MQHVREHCRGRTVVRTPGKATPHRVCYSRVSERRRRGQKVSFSGMETDAPLRYKHSNHVLLRSSPIALDCHHEARLSHEAELVDQEGLEEAVVCASGWLPMLLQECTGS